MLNTKYTYKFMSRNCARVLPAGLTCLKEAAAGISRALFSSLTSCHAFRASHRLMKPGAPFSTDTHTHRVGNLIKKIKAILE